MPRYICHSLLILLLLSVGLMFMIVPTHAVKVCSSDSDCNAPMIPGTNLNNGYCSPATSTCVCYEGITGDDCRCRSTHTCNSQGTCGPTGACECHAWSENGVPGAYFGPSCACKHDGDPCHTESGLSGLCVKTAGGCVATNSPFLLAETRVFSAPPFDPFSGGYSTFYPFVVAPPAGKTLKNTQFTLVNDACFFERPDGTFALNEVCVAKYDAFGIIGVYFYRNEATSTYTATPSNISLLFSQGLVTSSVNSSGQQELSGQAYWNGTCRMTGYKCGWYGSPCIMCNTRTAVLMLVYQFA